MLLETPCLSTSPPPTSSDLAGKLLSEPDKTISEQDQIPTGTMIGVGKEGHQTEVLEELKNKGRSPKQLSVGEVK